jgi:osmoprotectant transport system substrate-binding protein
MKRWLTRPYWVLALILVMLAAACGDDDDDSSAASSATTAASGSATATTAGSSTASTATTAAGSGTATTVAGGPKVVIGSFNFPESELLGELYGQALAAKGIDVDYKASLGNREVVEPALESGQIGLVAEYAATLLEFVNGNKGEATPDAAATVAKLKTELTAKKLTALDPSPAIDSNGFVVTKATADKYKLTKVSDLAAVGGQLTLGGPPECETRPFCALGLKNTYGIDFKEVKSLDAGGPLTVQALDAGQIDVGLLFTTDSTIVQKGWVLLDDDKHLQLADNVTPVLTQSLVDAYGAALTDTLNAVSAKLTTADLTQMNSDVADGKDAQDVAGTYLKDKGLI